MRPAPWALAGPLAATRKARVARGPELPRVSVVLAGGMPAYQFTTSLGSVIAPSTPALDEALRGLRLGELVVDQSNARDLVNRIAAMDAKAANAQSLLRTNAAEAAPFMLSQSLATWFKLRDSTRSKVDAVAAAAQKAILLGTPQSAPDDGVTALNDLETKVQDIDDTTQMIRAQLPATTAPPSGTVPSVIGTTPNWLGLPWWAWALFGLGGIGLIALFAAAGSSSAPALIVTGRS